ncbi:hypothetical protein GGX14DRAFT_524377 [Mycena pura]|uniref:Uncharacterized protein n=1 Tax=Mycena pura TaxID=153505 RepID=A0AAD6Y9S4_9AGAR|nr:hypothetical protein GGX14DRAFT_524377 [Mycena pura]
MFFVESPHMYHRNRFNFLPDRRTYKFSGCHDHAPVDISPSYSAMLARLSAAVSQVELSSVSLGDERFFFDADTFQLVLTVPDVTWGSVAQMCEHAVHPLCKGLYSILERDMENVAQILAALEVSPKQTEQSIPSLLVSLTHENIPNPPSMSANPMVIPGPHPSIPTIVITPCSRQPPEAYASSQIPCQDSAFRNQLTVPTVPSLNYYFPPMLPLRRVRSSKNWIWKNGHWQAIKGPEPRPRTLKHHRKKGRAKNKSQPVQG